MTSTVSGVLLLLMASAQGVSPPQDRLPLLDAVRAAISRHPALDIQRQDVEIAEAVRRQESSVFDRVVDVSLGSQRQYFPSAGQAGFSLSPTDTSQILGAYSRMLRNGMVLGGSVDLLRQVDPRSRGGLTTSTTQLHLLFPLMQGRGNDVTTAGERTAGLRRQSSVLELRHLTAALMTRVVSSYWGLVAADRSRRVAVESAERGALLVANTRALIAGDQVPQSDLASALANAADREAGRFVAEQAYVAAREQLVLDMGYRSEELSPTLSLDDFPVLGARPSIQDLPPDPEPFVADALARRADYAAAERRIEAAGISRDAARNLLRPQVDLSVNVGYTALAEGRTFGQYFSAVGAGIEGPDVIGRISYRFPLQNQLAGGRFAQAESQLRQAALARDDLARTIRSAVIASHSAVRNALLRLERAHESVAAFQSALTGEQDKLALGTGSIVNLLSIEDRLTAAADREVAAWRSYGQALVEFRFATGSLVPLRDELPPLDLRTFVTLPLASGGSDRR